MMKLSIISFGHCGQISDWSVPNYLRKSQRKNKIKKPTRGKTYPRRCYAPLGRRGGSTRVSAKLNGAYHGWHGCQHQLPILQTSPHSNQLPAGRAHILLTAWCCSCSSWAEDGSGRPTHVMKTHGIPRDHSLETQQLRLVVPRTHDNNGGGAFLVIARWWQTSPVAAPT